MGLLIKEMRMQNNDLSCFQMTAIMICALVILTAHCAMGGRHRDEATSDIASVVRDVLDAVRDEIIEKW